MLSCARCDGSDNSSQDGRCLPHHRLWMRYERETWPEKRQNATRRLRSMMVLFLFDRPPTGQLLTRQLPALAIVPHSGSATLSCCQCAVVGIVAQPQKLPAARNAAAWETERWTTGAQPQECLVSVLVRLHLCSHHDQSSSAAECRLLQQARRRMDALGLDCPRSDAWSLARGRPQR